MESRCSSSRARLRAYVVVVGISIGLGSLTSGCATVRPEDKEYLAQPAMTFGSDGATAGHEEHVFANREGSAGGGTATGGGCGCN